MKIELHKQFKVPISGLNGLIPVAEEIELKKDNKRKDKSKAFEEQSSDEEENPEGEDSEEIQEVNPRKAAKKLMKAERRERRKQKKELKLAFKTHQTKMQKQQTVTHAGEIRPGVSVRKIA